jgi:hypothetical protein
MTTTQERITTNPRQCGGRPCIRGMRIRVTDVLDLSPTISCLPASGSVFVVGDTTVTCTATDAAGNIGQDSPVVSVVTTDAVVADVLGEIDLLLTDPGFTVAWHDLDQAHDNLDKALTKLADDDTQKGLKEIGNAVGDLRKAVDTLTGEGMGPTPITALIGDLVPMAGVQAQDAIDAAVTGGGDQADIDKALTQMIKAQQDLDNNKPDNAIRRYSTAWSHAHNSFN